jgi:hypothetical protein
MGNIILLETPRLDELWPDWLSALDGAEKERPGELAAPFYSAASASWEQQRHRFMIVGQATRGAWRHEDFDANASPSTSLEERKRANREHIACHKRSAFWRAFEFGSGLSATTRYDNAVWTNIGKIGLCTKNIDGSLMSRQSELATETLRVELEEYRPTLVHFATGQVGDKCILAATGTKDSDWSRLGQGDLNDIWFIRIDGCSMVWTRHPNWAKPHLVAAWNDKLMKLANG